LSAHVIRLDPAALHAHHDLAHFLAVEIAKELHSIDAGMHALRSLECRRSHEPKEALPQCGGHYSIGVMAAIPKKVSERLTSALKKFQPILSASKARDDGEADTVMIVTDMLAYVFGYDKYSEVTAEYAIRGTFCDLATKIDGTIQALVEVKAIGLELKDAHVKQAVDYAANQGVDWVVLTNGRIALRVKRRIEINQASDFIRDVLPQHLQVVAVEVVRERTMSVFLLRQHFVREEAEEFPIGNGDESSFNREERVPIAFHQPE
jgi:Type I restriction enzyme R protein N terminus (HSDR_N)